MANSVLSAVDAQLDALFAGWNVYSTTLVVCLVAYLFYPIFFGSEPDTHPILLSRQAAPSPVRQPGESAVYHALEIPHGYPLRAGLNVKDEGASKWAPGRAGDLRDVWREAAKAAPGKNTRILSVKGRDEPINHDFETLSKQINIIGKHVQGQGGKRVAIYLPNSTEFLVALFACAFYGLNPILVPQGLTSETLVSILRDAKADVLLATAGIVTEDDVAKLGSSLKYKIWVAEQTSQHMDWFEGPQTGNNVAEFYGLIKQNLASASADLPTDIDRNNAPDLITIWEGKGVPHSYQIGEYTQANVIAAIAAQAAALPRNHRLEEQDLVVSLDHLSLTFPLTIVLAALFCHASIALTSVAGDAPDFDLAFQRIKPTVIIASAKTIANTIAQKRKENEGFFQKIHQSRQASALAAGVMRGANTISNGQTPRLIFTSERAGADSPPLGPQDLTDLRILTGARVVYALTLPHVAGAVAQSNMLDYRNDSMSKTRSHFGAPLSSVEVKVVETPPFTISDETYSTPTGHLVVSGPAVVGGTANTGVVAKFGNDHTLSLA